MKKLLICGMMLGFMTGASFAQRGRAAGGAAPAVGGVGPTARMPGNSPVVRTTPNAVTATHQSTAPNAVSGSAKAKTVTPNATGGAATTVSPNAGNTPAMSPSTNTVPDRATNPDAQGSNDNPRINPNQ
jgi:hypothetical protein